MKNRSKLRRLLKWLGTLGIITPMVTCTANGSGVSDVNSPSAPPPSGATLYWNSVALAPDRGQISGTLANGTHYVGRYVEVMPSAEPDLYEPAWEGWRPYWTESAWAGPSSSKDWASFVQSYAGTVIANMRSDDGETRLRCRFIIDTPATGLAGGSDGLCETSDGAIIDDVMLAVAEGNGAIAAGVK